MGGGSQWAGGFLLQQPGWVSKLPAFKFIAAFRTFGNTGSAAIFKLSLFARRVWSPLGGWKTKPGKQMTCFAEAVCTFPMASVSPTAPLLLYTPALYMPYMSQVKYIISSFYRPSIRGIQNISDTERHRSITDDSA